jgi:hypothetical protein
MSARRESDALHARVRAFARAFERGRDAPEPFDAVAGDLARFQASFVAGYRRLCDAHGVEPAAIRRAEQAPAVPSAAFGLGKVFAFEVGDASATFRTSGTTGGPRGTHRMRLLDTYDTVALAFGRSMFARDLTGVAFVFVIGPSLEEAPDSSLAYMCALFARVFGRAFGQRPPLEQTFFVREGELDLTGLRRSVAGLDSESPVLILATSFGLVHLLEALDGDVLALPARSRVMQTGGFKARSREPTADALRRDVARAFGVPERAVVGEYGMTELSSQFWEATLVDPASRHGVYVEPPWARVVPVDPETLIPVRAGEVGIARIEDLANVDSAFAVLTEDRVRRVPGGFELLGRSLGAHPRGCSIGLEEMVSSGKGHGP